jgi:oligoendopeptidase F
MITGELKIMSDKKPTGAEKVLWDLSGLYKAIDDPQIEKDLQIFVEKAQKFEKNFKSQLNTKLGDAIREQIEMTRYEYTLFRMPSLLMACDQVNEDIKQLMSKVSETISRASSQHLTFFTLEIGKLDEKSYQQQLKNDADVAKHKPMLDNIREQAKYMLSEDAEKMAGLLSPFGPSEWDDFVDEMESEMRFDFEGKSLTLAEALHIASTSKSAEQRKNIMLIVNKGLKDDKNDRFRARALNAVMGQKSAMDATRGYKTAMSSRNLSNHVEDATVDALHKAVQTTGVEAGKRFYKLLSQHLNGGQFKVLQWSDRNAPLPASDTTIIPWKDAITMVENAYRSFSPTLADLVAKIIKNNWVDAPSYAGKSSGAFNASGPYLKGNYSYNLLNYLGSSRDVATLAHELGHGVHGLLALEEQNALMWHAPMAYAETASIFGEMVTFNYLLDKCHSDEEKLDMFMNKISDFMNTVVRQISFSVFEQRIHAMRSGGKLKVEDFNKAWLGVCVEFYGDDGEVFTYDHEMMDSLWSYVGHFMNPFYVYAYAFGELFTQGLYSVKDKMSADFEPKYLDLLRAGGTKDAVGLMAPFGLNPNDPQFWQDGMKASVLKWLDEAEAITIRLQATKKAS